MSGEVILGTFFGSKIEKAETMSCETNLLEILAFQAAASENVVTVH